MNALLYGDTAFGRRRIPTFLRGASDEFFQFLKTDYITFSTETSTMREPPVRLGLHLKSFIGCTFKTLVDI